MRLSTRAHDRDSAGLKYVYPVVSRRAGGVSVGINVNTDNACNWRCVYCQVPNLARGAAPPVDLALLESELRDFLHDVLHGDFMQVCVPEGARSFKDIAISGNGEPTSAREFDRVVEVVGRVMAEHELVGQIELVLITNGSLMQKEHVRRGLRLMRALNGTVWFKIDSATDEGQARMNDQHAGVAATRRNLITSASECPTWIQTMMLARDGEAPSDVERSAYLDFLRGLVAERVPVRGVLLYGLARTSYQPEAPSLSALPREWMESFAAEIERVGLAVKLSL